MAQPPAGPEGPGHRDAPWTGPGSVPPYPPGTQHQQGPQYPPGAPQSGPPYPPGPQQPSGPPQRPQAPAPAAPHRPSNGFGPYGPSYGRPPSPGGGSSGGGPPWGTPPTGQPPQGPGGPRRPLGRALLIGAGAFALLIVIFVVSAVAVARHHAAEAYREAGRVPSTSAPASTPTPTPTATSPAASSTPLDPTSSATRPSSSATTASAEPRPTYHYTTNGARASRLYNVVFAAGSKGCRGIPIYRPPIPDAQLQAYARRIVACLVQINKGPLAKQGLKLTTPKVQTYHTSIDTPCGYLPLRKYPAWYCSKNITIYLNATTDDSNYGYYSADLGYWYILSHEFGHHLQHVGGIFGDYMQQRAHAGPQTRNELSRRLELQATCFSGVFLNASYASLKMTKADFDEYTWFLANYGDEKTGTHDHGSGANNVYWLERGYAGQWSSYGDCNTWTARSGRVS